MDGNDEGKVLVASEAQALALFGTEDPTGVIARAKSVAVVVADVIRDQNLSRRIGQGRREYVDVEGWTTMGALLGVFPHVEWVRAVEYEDAKGYEARVVVKTLDGRAVSAAEAECLDDETNWSDRPHYSLRSMAQTRATGKAMRIPLSWVMVLAGYEATPADEMDGAMSPQRPARAAGRLAEAKPVEAEPAEAEIANIGQLFTFGNKLGFKNAGDIIAALGFKGQTDIGLACERGETTFAAQAVLLKEIAASQ